MNQSDTNLIERKSESKLNGLVIFRFAHIFKDPNAGGVEQYLYFLNKTLLERNSITIIQMHLVESNCEYQIETENIGQGKLIWVPVFFKKLKKSKLFRKEEIRYLLKNLKFKALMKKYIINRYGYTVVNDKVKEFFEKQHLDIAIFHWLSYDSEEIIKRSIKNNIPYIVINHFENRMFEIKSIKTKISQAAGIGGITNSNVPRFLIHKYINLSDGIDTDFFNPENVTNQKLNFKKPIVFLPSRISPEKGHLDLIYTADLLSKQGINIKVIFAGRQNSLTFMEKISSFINKLEIRENIHFIGQLCLEELRNWYAASSVVVLPSYSEGLGRVLLEAQAMKKPVVAYNVGGVSEAIRNGETGYIVEKGNFQELAEKIKELLSNNKKRIQMGENGRNFIKKQFTLIELAKRHEEFYINSLCCSSYKKIS